MRERDTFEFTTDKTWDDTPELAPDAVRDVLVVGDIHGSKTHLADAIAHAADLGAQAVVQVGDFWLGDRHWSQFSPQQAEYMQAACKSPLPIVVIDGNHEIWPALGRYALSSAARESNGCTPPVAPWRVAVVGAARQRLALERLCVRCARRRGVARQAHG